MALVKGTNCGFVTVAPTTDPSGTSTNHNALSLAIKVTSSALDSKITEIGFWSTTTTDLAYTAGIYSHDSVNNRPLDIIGSSGGNFNEGSGWHTKTVDIDIEGNTIYWIAIACDGFPNFDFQALTGEKRDHKNNTGSTLPDPWGVSSGTSNTWRAIYGLVTSAAGTNLQLNIGDSWKSVDALKINIGDVWKDVVAVKQNIGDVWKDVF